jgi:cis-3-alkyl-4-acyloxetan-2-one decarboxylase
MFLFHKKIRNAVKRKYRLATPIDNGTGPTIVLLHGIASSSVTWDDVAPVLAVNYRVIAIDLLGFGKSPKPDACDYTVEDHARSVMFTLRKKKIRGNFVLIGHSMGSIIATHIAARHPKRVSQLVLCALPIYTSSDVNTSDTKKIDNLFVKIYQLLMQKSEFTLKAATYLMSDKYGLHAFTLTSSTWNSFQKSLQNTIIRQNTLLDADELSMPVHVISGTLDGLVIKEHLTTFTAGRSNFTLLFILSTHTIGKNYTKAIERVIAAGSGEPTRTK